MGGKVCFVIFLALLVNTVLTSIYHKQQKLNIYYDYSDAILTFGALISPVAVGFIFGMLINETVGVIAGWMTFIGGLAFVYRSSHINNINVKYAIMSTLTKYFVVTVYLVLMIGQGGKPSKNEGESDVAYELRSHHKAEGDAIRSAIFTALFTWFTYSMTRFQNFGSLGQYFIFNFNRKPIKLMFDDFEYYNNESEDNINIVDGEYYDASISEEQKLIDFDNNGVDATVSSINEIDCHNCGTILPPTFKFCHECGSQQIISDNCSSEITKLEIITNDTTIQNIVLKERTQDDNNLNKPIIAEPKQTVNISCPNCNFARDVPSAKVPTEQVKITCPSCKDAFIFNPVFAQL